MIGNTGDLFLGTEGPPQLFSMPICCFTLPGPSLISLPREALTPKREGISTSKIWSNQYEAVH